MVVIPNREPDVFAAISLRVLLDAGLVTEQRHGRERRYRLVPAQLRPVRDWMAYYERFWDEHLERLEKHLTKRDE
jgi:DNA-binding transcriptional ArsR family regulator